MRDTKKEANKMNAKQAAAKIYQAIFTGNQEEANRIGQEYTKADDYDTRAHTIRVTKLYNLGLVYRGTDWIIDEDRGN